MNIRTLMHPVPGLVLLISYLAGVSSALAAPKAPPTRVVMIAPVSDREASFRTLQAVRGQLSDVSATLAVHAIDQLDPSAQSQLRSARAVARQKKAAVVFWFNAKRARVSIYLHSAGGGRLLERPVQSAGAEGRFEALAVIVRFAVRAHLQGDKVGVRLPPVRPRRVRAPPPRRGAPPPRSAPPPRRRFWSALEATYDLDLYSSQITVAQGLRLAALLHLHRRWSIFVGFRMEAPLDVTSDKVDLSLRRIPLDLGARFTWRRGRFALGAQLALSVAVVTARTIHLDLEDGDIPRDVPTRAAVSLVPALVLGVQVARRLHLVLSLGARIHINSTRYRMDGEPSLLLAPWRVQPTLSVGIHVPLL